MIKPVQALFFAVLLASTLPQEAEAGPRLRKCRNLLAVVAVVGGIGVVRDQLGTHLRPLPQSLVDVAERSEADAEEGTDDTRRFFFFDEAEEYLKETRPEILGQRKRAIELGRKAGHVLQQLTLNLEKYQRYTTLPMQLEAVEEKAFELQDELEAIAVSFHEEGLRDLLVIGFSSLNDDMDQRVSGGRGLMGAMEAARAEDHHWNDALEADGIAGPMDWVLGGLSFRTAAKGAALGGARGALVGAEKGGAANSVSRGARQTAVALAKGILQKTTRQAVTNVARNGSRTVLRQAVRGAAVGTAARSAKVTEKRANEP